MSVALGPDSAEPISAADYVAAIASLVVLVIYFSLEVTLGLPISHSIGMYIVSFMIITITVPSTAAAIFKSKSTTYQTWVKKGAIDFKTIISMNATLSLLAS